MQGHSITSDAPKANPLERLQKAVEAIHDSEDFRRYLDVQSRFHRYSFGNCLMIAFQRPDATKVAGFHKWIELHRYVKKGEKGIAILAPCVYKVGTRVDDETGEEKAVYGDPRGFRLVYVFDVNQTGGEDLPTAPECPELTEDAGHDLYRSLMALAHREGLTVKVVEDAHWLSDDRQTMGSYNPSTKTIILRRAAMLQMVKTMAHELGHHFTMGVFARPREEAECMAEAIAYVVCQHYGLDTGARSFPYVAVWAKEQKVLKGVLQTVQQISTRMIESLVPDKASIAA